MQQGITEGKFSVYLTFDLIYRAILLHSVVQIKHTYICNVSISFSGRRIISVSCIVGARLNYHCAPRPPSTLIPPCQNAPCLATFAVSAVEMTFSRFAFTLLSPRFSAWAFVWAVFRLCSVWMRAQTGTSETSPNSDMCAVPWNDWACWLGLGIFQYRVQTVQTIYFTIRYVGFARHHRT